MRKISGLFSVMLMLFGLAVAAGAQFKPEELAEFDKWEDFLRTAEVTASDQMSSREAVTSPWVLTLEKDGLIRRGLWKNPSGRYRGFVEGWQWEIAAYRLSRHLHLDMVPPTVEKEFQGDRGSCQLWIEGCRTLKTITEEKVKKPSYKVFYWNRALYLQRAFDDLIANEDRHQNQYLVTEDWRVILVDHSRSFRTSSKFTNNLLYGPDGKYPINQLPRIFYVTLKDMTADIIRDVVGEYLDDKEIEAVLKRRDLLVAYMEKKIQEMGEEQVLYD